MKLFTAFLTTAAAIDDIGEKKVPRRHPIQRLNRLVQFTQDWIGGPYVDLKCLMRRKTVLNATPGVRFSENANRRRNADRKHG